MRAPQPHSGKATQQGAALMVMLVIMVMGAAAFLVSSLSTSAQKTARQEKTAAALAQAKEALIGYAITYHDYHTAETYGYLPCPDIDETGTLDEGVWHGNCGATDANSIGRLPWKSLGLPPLTDGSGECLWYAVSGTYKSSPMSGSKMNWDNTGKLKVFSSDGSSEIAANEIVAIVIAPGSVLSSNNPSQDRSGTAAPICGGNYTASAYLDNDTEHNINNSDIAAGKFILPHEHHDTSGNVTTTVNDQFVYITRHDIWSAIQKRITQEARECLNDYAVNSGSKYPWPAAVDDTTFYVSKENTLFGRLPKHVPITDTNIIAMMSAITTLQTATDNCKATNNPTNRAALDSAGIALVNAAQTVLVNQPTTPAIPTSVTTPATTAGNDAQDSIRCSLINSNPTGNSVQTNLDSANSAISAIPSSFNWPVGCTLFTSTSWNHWKDLVFYQVADGFKPSGTGSCSSSCLSIEGSGHNVIGSGSYRAALIAAGKKLTANRVTANPADYLETDNLLPKNDTTTPYKTYQTTDSNFQTINDLVLCLDGKVNCK